MLFVVSLVVVTTTALTIGHYAFVRELLRGSLERQLQLHGLGLAAAIESFSELQQERVLLVSSRTRLRQLLSARQRGEITAEQCRAQTQPILHDAASSTASFRYIRIAGPDGQVVATSDGASTGGDVTRDEAFAAGRLGVYMSTPSRTPAGLRATLSAPIIAADGSDLGVVLVEVDASQLQEFVRAIVAGYRTAEVRIATSSPQGIRYVLPVPGLETLDVATADDPAMARALRHESGFVDGSNHRGREVVAAHLPSGYRDWGLVVQLDATEAYAPIDRLLLPLLGIGLAFCALAILVGLRLAAGFVRPIRDLAAAARAIQHGDFTARANPTRNDEVGMLGHAFNHMARGIEDYRAEMQQRVEARTADLEQSRQQLRVALERAEQASSAKTQFLTSMSHEIRTPLNGILGMTEVLLQSRIDPDHRRHLQIVHESGRLLLRLLNDILDLSKVEAGKLELEDRDFSVRALATQTVQPFGPEASSKGIELECEVTSDSPDRVRGDADRLRQVLTNLIGNALKFTEQGRISVEIRVVEDGSSYRLSAAVRDTGIGIPADQLTRVFERFHQLENPRRSPNSGTGLGLTISAKLVERMGGKLTVESELGKGSVFRFDVMLARPAGDLEPHAKAGDAGAPVLQRTVLLVEDGDVNRQVAQAMLEIRGHRVFVASNGSEAMAQLASHPVDLVLMDVLMPEMDGLEATRRIRAAELEHGGHVPIIGLSAHALAHARERCLAAGMDDFITKPVSMHALDRVIEQWGQGTTRSGSPSEPAAGPANAPAEEPPRPQALPNPPTSTRARALHRVGDNEESLQIIVQKFNEEAPRLLAEAVRALEIGSVKDCERAAHTLKGAADILALDDLVELALAAERAARAGDLSSFERTLPALDEAVRQAIARVATW